MSTVGLASHGVSTSTRCIVSPSRVKNVTQPLTNYVELVTHFWRAGAMQLMRGKKMTELRQNEKVDVEPGGCMALSTRN